MSFKDLKNKAAAAATKANPAPATVPAAAESDEVKQLKAQLAAATKTADASVAQAEVITTNGQQDQGFLSLFQSAGGESIDSLLAAVETDGGGGGDTPFPVLTQVSGTGRGTGAFQAVDLKSHKNADLPEGTQPFKAVYLGYRWMATAWPEEYKQGVKQGRPVFSCAIAANKHPDPDTAARNAKASTNLMLAGKNYQFSKRRGEWAVSQSGPGIIKPIIEILLMDPEDEGLFVFRCCAHYNSAKDTRDQLLNQAAENNGRKALLPFVGSFKPTTHSKDTPNGNTIVHHYAEISKIDITDEFGRKGWMAYQNFAKTASVDIQEKVRNWLDGSDQPLTKACEDALEVGAANG